MIEHMIFPLASGWKLERCELNGEPEWIITDPDGDRLGDTSKHKRELDRALVEALNQQLGKEK